MPNVTPWIEFQVAQEVDEFNAFWNSPENALSFDDAEALSGPIGNVFLSSQTNPLNITSANLGKDFPDPFVLLGVEVEVRGGWTGASQGLRSVFLRAIIGEQVRQELGSGSLPLTVAGAFIKGGPTDTMNLSVADLMDPAFGFQLWGTTTTFNINGNILHIDSVRLRLHWDQPGSSGGAGRGRTRAAFTRGALA